MKRILILLLVTWFVTPPVRAEEQAPAVLRALEAELGRVKKGLETSDGVRPYYVAYEVAEHAQTRLSASWGALSQDQQLHNRVLDVDLRVGSPELDNTHELRGEQGRSRPAGNPVGLPVEDDVLVMRQAIWGETDRQFREAVERFSRVKASVAVKAEASEQVADFSDYPPQQEMLPLASADVDRDRWADVVRRASRVFLESSYIYDASVSLDVDSANHYFASSDGSRVVFGQNQVRLVMQASTRADDGMELYRYGGWEVRRIEDLPTPAEVEEKARELMEELEALREAPMVEPYTGPAIMSGRAAAVFFHEIFGHRIEGHRQKSEEEGQTFTRRIGERVLPAFISVYDDPSIESLGDTPLMGFYPYDNEGVPSQRVAVVEDGVLRTFLLSRNPVPGFARSNGHGRRQSGYPPVGRQGNLIVEADGAHSEAELRARLKELVREQGKPFGLYFEDISGGFTYTQRRAPQAYKVLPLMVYKVYPDDRPDELVRGVDIVGTPLASFGKIVATGGETEVFNGYCGAESGYVPVAAAAPGVLVSEMEIEKRAKGVDRPPILDPPTVGREERE